MTALAALLMSMVSVSNLPIVKASGTIYIRADGSIDPPAAPIQRDGDIYTLTGNITSDAHGIVIERDNMTLDGAGYTLQGPGDYEGIDLTGRSNVTINDTRITAFRSGISLDYSSDNNISRNSIANNGFGIYLNGSSNNCISRNNMTANNAEGIYLYGSSNNCISGNSITANSYWGVHLSNSSNNSISGNSITANSWHGILLYYSSDNSISGNNVANNGHGIFFHGSSNNSISGNSITANNWQGIRLYYYSSNNTISGNNITLNNEYGIYLHTSSGNRFYHNNFIGNTIQVYYYATVNVWDDGYPSGGNYWSDYTDIDLYSGPYQNETGSDGIWDHPYMIDADNQDRYSLVNPWTLPDVAVTNIALSKTVAGQGYFVPINVTVENQGSSTETFSVTVYANTTIIETREVTLDGGASITITFTWNTTDFAKGNYTIKAAAETIPGEIDTEDNTLTDGVVTITIPGDLDGNFEVRLVDLVILAQAYGSKPGEPKWNPNADIDDNGVVGLTDLVIMAQNYGKTAP